MAATTLQIRWFWTTSFTSHAARASFVLRLASAGSSIMWSRTTATASSSSTVATSSPATRLTRIRGPALSPVGAASRRSPGIRSMVITRQVCQSVTTRRSKSKITTCSTISTSCLWILPLARNKFSTKARTGLRARANTLTRLATYSELRTNSDLKVNLLLKSIIFSFTLSSARW